MQTTSKSYTVEGVLSTLGYPDPMMAARQQARIMLLGRLARYEAAIRQIENRQGNTLAELRERYTTHGSEDYASDDDYLEWQWYVDAIKATKAQLAAVSEA